MLAGAFDLDPASIERLPLWAQLESGDALIVRTDDTDLPTFDLFVPASGFQKVTSRLANAGAVNMTSDLVEALRIEAGRPAFGIDMTEETIPLEPGLLDRAISTTKGCYVGQEVIVRVLHRGGGRVAKRLVRLNIDPAQPEAPAAGAAILIDGREVGRVTSAGWSPRLDHAVALGYVHRDAAEPGRQVSIGTESGAAPATIAAMAG